MRRGCSDRRRGHRALFVAVSTLALLNAAASQSPAAPTTPANPATVPSWSVVASPSPITIPEAGVLSVACPRPGNCVAVGTYNVRFASEIHSMPFVEQSSAGVWSAAPGPVPAGSSNPSATLNGVACTAFANCFAVGDYSSASTGHATLIERWNGSTWSAAIGPTPRAATVSHLASVSCPAPTRCIAVGYSSASSASHKTLTEAWNGTSWSVVPSPNPSTGASSALASVACTSATSCFAVGSSQSRSRPGVSATLIERWNGAAWSIVPSPSAAGATSSALSGVSCASRTTCFAVGVDTQRLFPDGVSLLEQWNGTRWSVARVPTPPNEADNQLLAISCGAPTSCVATGTSDAAGDSGFSDEWNGTSWKLTTGPALHIAWHPATVACASAKSCVAFYNGQILLWNGTGWTLLNTGGSQASLTHVACSSASACFAIGTEANFDFRPQQTDTFLERWNGTRWQIVPSATQPGKHVVLLSGISCPTATSCFAVGTRSHSEPAIERWNGTAWSLATTPATVAPSFLNDVSCTSAANCFAVGSNGNHTLVERWDGAQWAIVPSPDTPNAFQSGLGQVQCTSTNSCVATGAAFSNDGQPELAERWDGTAWSIIPSPSDGRIDALSCWADNACAALTNNTQNTLNGGFARWNGSAWSEVAFPDESGFVSLSCVSASSCVAVGGDPSGGPIPPLIDSWDGSEWSPVTGATPAGAISGGLSSVTCLTATHCIAVGGFQTALSLETLVEQLS